MIFLKNLKVIYFHHCQFKRVKEENRMEIGRNFFFYIFEIEDDVKNHLSNPNCNENVLLFQLLISMMSYIFIH